LHGQGNAKSSISAAAGESSKFRTEHKITRKSISVLLSVFFFVYMLALN
jgi:hypothetical protein